MGNSRAEFEKWYSSIDGYGDAHKKDLWECWKASRASLCVVLPEANYGEIREDDIVLAFDEVGVSYK